jgi:8-oxo-dGTP pyrophosphatase MutT (NUDIX family)
MSSTQVISSPRAGRQGELRLGCSGVLLTDSDSQVLLTKRRDNDLWCLPGGRVDAGETVTEAMEREFLEETGIHVRIRRLSGIYSDPDKLIVYPDGNKAHVIVMTFLLERLDGSPRVTSETTEIRFIHVSEALKMDLFHGHADQLRDALTNSLVTVIK